MLHEMEPLDAIDEKILQALDRHGRLSNTDLAERINLSPSATSRRMADLERRGIITGYKVVIDRAKIGQLFTAYVTVGLSLHTKAAQEAFEKAMSRAPEVRECHNISGVFEYLLRVETSDLAAYKHFHTEVLGTLPQVSSLTSYIVMGRPTDERA